MITDRGRDAGYSAAVERLAAQITIGARKGSAGVFAVLVDKEGVGSARGLSRLLKSVVEEGGIRVAFGTAAGALHRPYGPFPEIVAAVVRDASCAAEVVTRYGRTVRSLAPHAAGSLLERVRPFEAQLVGYALHGNRHGLLDYYVGRNVRPRIIDDLVRFLLDTADHPQDGREPLLLCIDGLEGSDETTIEVLRNLRRYADARPLSVVASWSSGGMGHPDVFEHLERTGWEILPISAEGDGGAAAGTELSPEERAALRAAAVLPGRFDLEGLLRTTGGSVEGVARALKALVARGLVVQWATFGYTVPAPVAAGVASEMQSDEVAALHSAAIRGHEGGDLFERAHHMRVSRAPGFGEVALQALEVAWGLSAYEAAERHAQIAFSDEGVASRCDRNLLLGLLYYEACRFTEAHEHLIAALKAQPDEEARVILQRLIGYNGVFGIRRFDIGLDFLDRARVYHEARGNTRDAAWIRNTMAFGLMQSGRAEEAIALERTTLEAARQLPYPDRFLLSILHLNLGRLHRRHSLEEAVAYIRRSIADNRGESGPYMLLLFYITLGNLYISGNRPREAAAYFARCVDLAFDIDLAGFSDRTFPLLARIFTEEVGPVSTGLRGDVARLLCHFNLAFSYRCAGLPDEAECYSRWISREIVRWGTPEQVATVRHVLGTEAGASAAAEEPAPDQDDGVAEAILEAHRGYLTYRRTPTGAQEIGERLAEGSVVALLASGAGAAAMVVRSYVLFDPRSAAARRRVQEQLGRQPQAGGVLALPAAAALFEGANPDCPAVVQEVTLKRELREALPGIFPIRTRLRFIDESWIELAAIAGAFARRTSIPFIGAMSLRRAGEEIADTPALAAKLFLETSLDYLLLDLLVVEKTLGASAPANLFLLRPQFSGFAAMPAEVEPAEPAVVMARHHRVRIGPGGTAVLSRCDGRTTVGELVQHAAEAGTEPAEVCDFLLDLRRLGVIHFAQA